MSSKENNKWAILANFSPCKYEVDRTRHIPSKRLQNQSIRGQISIGIQLRIFQWECHTKNFQPLTCPTEKRNSFQWTRLLHSSIQVGKREAVYQFFQLCLNKIWAPGQSDRYISKNSSFFWLTPAGNLFSAPTGPRRAVAVIGSINISQKHNCCSERSKTSEDS